MKSKNTESAIIEEQTLIIQNKSALLNSITDDSESIRVETNLPRAGAEPSSPLRNERIKLGVLGTVGKNKNISMTKIQNILVEEKKSAFSLKFGDHEETSDAGIGKAL